jgi:hypothetical protein
MSSTNNAEQKQSLKMSLIEIENKKSNVFFGLENILREMGQIYEACEFVHTCDTDIPFQSDDLVSISHTVLPRYACVILQEGYSIEILDGDACSVPLVWVKKIFSEFSHISGQDKPSKIHIISVLGIQSSGKSTFLNTVFGMQFPVSAGRCTRGAFVQVVKVHPSAHGIIKEDLDYIFVVDTEGLKSVLLSPTESVKHDNELSTFAIGSSQTTVINLMSENSTYLSENLPIVVHAFLRMFMVKLHRRCVIVHHNMDKSNKNKLLEQEMVLRNILDKLTRRACELEQLPRLQFEDIIQFDIQNHTTFIPSLLEGKLPMAPISASYSREAYITKRNILNLIPTDIDKDCIKSSASFSESLGKLWTAIKKDRFVYEYRNTREICLKLEVDFDYMEILREVLHIIVEETNICISKVQNGSSTQGEIVERFREFIVKQREVYTEQLREMFIKRKMSSDFLTNLNQKYIDNLQREFNKSEKSFENQITFCLKQPNIHKVLLGNLSLFRNLFKQNDNNFNVTWDLFIETVLKIPDYLYDAVTALQSIYPDRRNKIEKENIERSPLLKDFVVDSEIHINHTFMPLEQAEINALVKKMYEIKHATVAKFESDLHELIQDMPVYSDLITKQILLGIDTSLRQKLKIEDNSMHISFQYKIDVLMSVAKTYVRKMTQLYTKGSDIRKAKSEVHSIMLIEFKREKEATEVLLELLGKSIVCELDTKLEMTVNDAMMKSCIRQKIRTKMFAIGHFVKHISLSTNEKLIKQYRENPVCAFKQYLFTLCKDYVSKEFIQDDLQFYVRLRIKDVWNAIENEWEKDRKLITQTEKEGIGHAGRVTSIDNKTEKYTGVTLEKLIQIIAKETCLSFEFKHVAVNSLFSFRSMKIQSLQMFKDIVSEKIENFIGQQVEILRKSIHDELESLCKSCSKKLFKRLIGCTECCAKCNEICILSENHADDHIYIFHRPIANADDIDHINISCVLKRLAHQCFINGKNVFEISMQQGHEDFCNISEEEVINEIRKVLKIEEY